MAVFGHWANHLITLFKADQELLHVSLQVGFELFNAVRSFDQLAFQTNRVFTQPTLVRLRSRQLLIDLVGVHDFAGLGIDRQNLTRPYTAFGDHVFRLVIVSTDFRGQGNEAVIRNDISSRAQTVTVKQANRVAAFGQYQAGRTIPGLHVHRVVIVEGAQFCIHALNVLPSRRNHHADGAEQIHTTGDQDF